MDELLHEWSEWAWCTGNDARTGMRIWAWLSRHDKPLLNLAFKSREPMEFPFR